MQFEEKQKLQSLQPAPCGMMWDLRQMKTKIQSYNFHEEKQEL
jgi:hypothetical protein